MKKLLTLITGLCATAVTAYAQAPEMAKAIVHYKFSHVRDTTAKDKPYTENMVLLVGPTASVYKSFDRKTQDALMRKQLEQQMAEQRGNGSAKMDFKITSSKAVTRAEWFQFSAANKMFRKDQLITPYLIEDQLPVINWKISSDTASFGTLLCQKATAHFKGRDYTAWFCPDLPFRTGPWKLTGLPGLIVEAYDTNKEVEFKFDGMEQAVASPKKEEKPAEAPPTPGNPVIRFGMDDNNADPNLIALPTNAVKTNEKEFTRLQEAMRKDPQAFMAASGGNAGRGAGGGNVVLGAPPAGGMGQIRSVSINMNGGSPTPFNNPLELPEKKSK